MHVYLGNHAGLDKGRRLDFLAVTDVQVPPGTSANEAFVAFTDPAGGFWQYHSEEPAAWVVVEPDAVDLKDEAACAEAQERAHTLAEMLSQRFACPIGMPDDVEEKYYTRSGPPGTGPAVAEEMAP